MSCDSWIYYFNFKRFVDDKLKCLLYNICYINQENYSKPPYKAKHIKGNISKSILFLRGDITIVINLNNNLVYKHH